ncbi:type VII secretion protein EccB [Corynebacterium comes]|uniref:ESX-1 secretion system protein eccB1 n=1 Tax=Corynebacterium comes TaxID=2675218 RepID=A0A6B8VYK3_9CORY|nr:type VII secretion protein EccB [Corynebacterium comes]QGU03776.1 ESX-1 secretion system protein eccB1 [Corynebacterium comes]
MSSALLPTTRAQVTGHRFLRRRVEHGLVFGDIRMIHDPLSARHRAVLFGLVATVLIAVGAGLLAWLRPAANPGDAPILQAVDGALFVRVDDRVHPVANLASARLIVGEPAQPARIGEDLLAATDRGVPLGIHPAPVSFGGGQEAELTWSACYGEDRVTVAAGDHVAPLGGHRGVLATAGGADWLLTTDGRRQLPHPDSPEGRIIRRALAITADTPRWVPPVEVLNAAAEHDPLTIPEVLPEEILDTGTGLWVRLPSGVSPVSETQAQALADAGVAVRRVPRADLAGHPDATHDLSLPALMPLWIDPAELTVCASDEGTVTTLRPAEHRPVTLSGEGVADEFLSSANSAIAVDTGHGHHVIDTTGLRHPVPHTAGLTALGMADTVPAPWAVIRLLPDGESLTAEAALRAAY